MISFICSGIKKEHYPLTNKEIVFVGRSNVGKSSIINALYGKAAYVGKTPGKTKILNFFNYKDKYTVCDAPGYGYAKRSDSEVIQFGEMMEEYFSSRNKLKLCILILDIRRIPNNDDLDMYDYLKHNDIPVLFVLNKSDKLSNNQIFNQLKVIEETLNISKDNYLITSTLSKKNIDVLKDTINKHLL